MKILRLAAALAAAVAVAGVASPALAATSKADPTKAALARIADGTYTSADVVLIKSDPKLASTTPDPTNVVVTVDENVAAPTSGGLQSADLLSTTYCGAWAQVNITQNSWTGSKIYTWSHYVQYCRDGSKVLKWESRYDFLSYSTSVVQWGGLTADSQAGIGTYSAWSYRQRHLTYCTVKYGCYANVYPWSKITVNALGKYSYTYGGLQ